MCPERKWKGQTMRHSGLGEWREKQKSGSSGLSLFSFREKVSGKSTAHPR